MAPLDGERAIFHLDGVSIFTRGRLTDNLAIRPLESAGAAADNYVRADPVSRAMAARRMRLVHQLLLVLVFTATQLFLQHLECVAATKAPNYFLGTCLDEAWVKKIEADLGVSRYQRDTQGRLVNPHLHASLKVPRFTVSDPRTAFATSKLYRDDCKFPGSVIYGVGATVDGQGNVVDPGRVNGTLVVEIKPWESSQLVSNVFSIITRELFGYEISYLSVVELDLMAQRMSSVGAGACSPVHVAVEVKTNSYLVKKYAVYSNESYSSGSIGYPARSGLYTTVDFIKNGLDATKNSPTFGADFWRDYQSSEKLFGNLKVSTLKANSVYYPPRNTAACKDGSLGCVNSCSKTAACFAREAQSKECMVVAMLLDVIDPGYLQAVFENNDIPAYFCFLGYEEMEFYVVEAQQKGQPVVFHHYEPDSFHIEYAGLFERVLLPRSTPERSLVATGTFGEFGDGKKTANPVRVDFPLQAVQKYSSTLIQDLTLVNSLISRMEMEELELNELMKLLVDFDAALSPPEDIMFASACSWLRNNYEIWSLWLGRLPQCDVYFYLAHDYIGCESENSTIFPREVHSRWLFPNPENTSMPHNCDGGITEPPQPLITSKSCEWLLANRLIWIFWISVGKPACDSTFYTYDVSPCDRANSQREVMYRWLIPDSKNASLSAECAGGSMLPPPVLLNCGYVPKSDSRYIVIAALAGVLSFFIFIAFVFVFWNRKQPIIKRSQYQFLLLLLVGGMLICGAVWSYAGKPTDFLCATRSSSIAYGFTFVFGSLVVKSLRVYRVFMSGAMKRVVLSTKTMFKILSVFLVIDFLILATWSTVDPAKAKFVEVETPEIGGGFVLHIECTSSSFIFTALLIFWKAVLLFTGLYLSFLIRKVSSDFQESVWIFASALIVLFTSIIILALAYLVELPAITFYMFFSFLLLVSTAMVMGLMIIPKIMRLHERSTDPTTSTTGAGGTSGGSGNRGSNSTSSGSSAAGKKAPIKTGDMKSIIPGFRMPSIASNDSKRKKSKVQVTPIQEFKINDE